MDEVGREKQDARAEEQLPLLFSGSYNIEKNIRVKSYF
jgi:hypothetical protein